MMFTYSLKIITAIAIEKNNAPKMLAQRKLYTELVCASMKKMSYNAVKRKTIEATQRIFASSCLFFSVRVIYIQHIPLARIPIFVITASFLSTIVSDDIKISIRFRIYRIIAKIRGDFLLKWK